MVHKEGAPPPLSGRIGLIFSQAAIIGVHPPIHGGQEVQAAQGLQRIPEIENHELNQLLGRVAGHFRLLAQMVGLGQVQPRVLFAGGGGFQSGPIPALIATRQDHFGQEVVGKFDPVGATRILLP